MKKSIKIKKVAVYNFTAGSQAVISSDDGKYKCSDSSLFEPLKAAESAEITVLIDGDVIVGLEQTPDKSTPDTSEIPDESAESISEAKTAEEVAFTSSSNPTSFAFPLLKKEEIDVRVDQVYTDYATLLLYKDARCDQERFDKKYSPFGWKCSFQSIDGKLFCAIAVWDETKREWVEKQDVGVESTYQPEKGRASDALKRAAVCWGSGRELYSAPPIRIKASDTVIAKKDNGKLVVKDEFSVSRIEYDSNRCISALEIYGEHSKKIVFRWNKA